MIAVDRHARLRGAEERAEEAFKRAIATHRRAIDHYTAWAREDKAKLERSRAL